MAEPVDNDIHKLTWSRRILFVGGTITAEVGSLFVWRVAHAIIERVSVRSGLTLVGFGVIVFN